MRLFTTIRAGSHASRRAVLAENPRQMVKNLKATTIRLRRGFIFLSLTRL